MAGEHDTHWQFTQPTQACHVVSDVSSCDLVDQHVVINYVAAQQSPVVEECDATWTVSGQMEDCESPLAQIGRTRALSVALTPSPCDPWNGRIARSAGGSHFGSRISGDLEHDPCFGLDAGGFV